MLILHKTVTKQLSFYTSGLYRVIKTTELFNGFYENVQRLGKLSIQPYLP